MTDTKTVTRLESKIIDQVEHYFSDANIIRDEFLLREIGKNAHGWVPISIMLRFRRLAALSTDAAVIAAAIQKSNEGLIEVNEDKTKIRRHPERPIPELNPAKRRDIMSRTAFAGGFPKNMTMDELLEYFENFEKVERIHLIKFFDGMYHFNGSVMVTFEKKEQAQYFIEKANPMYMSKKLEVKWQASGKYF